MTAASIATAAPVRAGTMLAYGVGQVGGQIFRDTPAVLLPIFMVTMLGVPAWLAGLAVLLPKSWVIACDPMMGAWSDRLEARHGRGRFLAAGAILSALGFLALFSFTAYPSPTIAAVAVCFLFLLASTGFSAFSVPYLALAAELSGDTHERTRILVYRTVFTIFGVILGVGVAQPLVFHFGGRAHGWRVMATLFALICFAAMMATALGFRNFRAPARRGPSIGIVEQLRLARANRPFLLLTGTHFVQCIGQACGYSVVGLVFLYPIGDVGLLPTFIIVMSAAGLLTQPFWLRSSRRYGKLRMFVIASIAWSLLTVTWIWVGRARGVEVALPLIGPVRAEESLVLVRGGIIGFVNSGFVLLAVSMLTDTMNHRQAETGPALEGAYAGLWSAAEKLAFAMGPALSGALLSAAGFKSSTTGAIAQSDGAITGILLIYSLIPAAFGLLSLLLLRNYTRCLDAR